MSKITLTLDYFDAGWLFATLSTDEPGQEPIHLTASYLYDTPGFLAAETVALLQGAKRVTCLWEEELGEMRWVITRTGDQAEIRLLWFDDTYSNQPDERGQLIYETECDLLRFATQVKGLLHQLLSRYGEQGYADRWRGDFPKKSFDDLIIEIQTLKAWRKRNGDAPKPRNGAELVEYWRKEGLIGSWADREDIGDTLEYARKLRKQAETRDWD